MKIGDLEILAALDRDGTPYSSQEDLYLRVTFKNLSDQAAVIPYLIEHPARYHLKDKVRKTEKKVAYAPPASLGTPAPEPHPEASVGPGETVTYNLLAQFALGFIPGGEYAFQYSFDFPGLAFASDWFEIVVLPQKVGMMSHTESSLGPSERLHLVWSDEAAKPPRALFQRSYIGPSRPLVARTLVVGEGDAVVSPVASMSSPGLDALTAWVGWISNDNLVLARITGNDQAKARSFPIPAPAHWNLINALNYAESPGGKNPVLSGMLIGRDAKKNLLMTGFVLASASGLVWLPPVSLPGGPVLAAKVLPLAPHRHFALWIRKDGTRLKVEGLDWLDSKGPGTVLSLSDLLLAVDEEYQGMDATLEAGHVKWTVLVRKPGLPGKSTILRRIGHGFDPQARKTSAGAPRSIAFTGLPSARRAGIRFDGLGAPWVLQRDVHGPWAQGADMPEPLVVEAPMDIRMEDLVFRNQEVPKVLWLNPAAGFESVAVPLDAAEEEEDDEALVGSEDA